MTGKSRSERGDRAGFTRNGARPARAGCLSHRRSSGSAFHLRFYTVFAVLILHRLQPAQQAELAGPAELRQGVHGRPVLLPVFRQYVLFCCCAGAHCAGGVAAAGHPHQCVRQLTKGYRVALFLPSITSTVAVRAWRGQDLQPGHGHPEQHFTAIGLNDVPLWLGDPAWSKPALVIMRVWQMSGYYMLMFLAGLQTIPETL